MYTAKVKHQNGVEQELEIPNLPNENAVKDHLKRVFPKSQVLSVGKTPVPHDFVPPGADPVEPSVPGAVVANPYVSEDAPKSPAPAAAVGNVPADKNNPTATAK